MAVRAQAVAVGLVAVRAKAVAEGLVAVRAQAVAEGPVVAQEAHRRVTPLGALEGRAEAVRTEPQADPSVATGSVKVAMLGPPEARTPNVGMPPRKSVAREQSQVAISAPKKQGRSYSMSRSATARSGFTRAIANEGMASSTDTSPFATDPSEPEGRSTMATRPGASAFGRRAFPV